MHRLITDSLLALLFLFPTIQWRVELNGGSFTLFEPVALLTVGWLVLEQLARGRLAIRNDGFTLILSALVLWVAAIRPLGEDTRHGLSDLRDWAVPVLSYILLVATHKARWRKRVLLFVGLAVGNAFLGFYQHVFDTFRPFATEMAEYKVGFSMTEEGTLARVSYGVGLFGHPNDYAMYLFMAVMVAFGWLGERGGRILKVSVTAALATAAFWAYAKASILVMMFMSAAFWVNRRFRSRTRIRLSVLAAVAIGGATLYVGLYHLPETWLLTFWWRVDLWQSAVGTLAEYPGILLVGNGLDLYASRAVYPQPHNLYLYTLLTYGMVGLALLLCLLINILRQGYEDFRKGVLMKSPLLGSVWMALIGFFAIGLVESNLLGIESRMLFVIVLACFSGLRREVRSTA